MKQTLICYIAISIITICGFTHAATDITTPTGGIITYSSSLAEYGGDKAFDNDFGYSSKWLPYSSNLPNVYVIYQFTNGNTYAATSYRIVNQNYLFAPRAPKDFTFEGSTNGTDWTVLDSRIGETGWTESEARIYEFDNTDKYSYFKLNISANNGDSTYVGINEIEIFDEMFEAPQPAYSPVPNDNTIGARTKLILQWVSDISVISDNVYLTTNALISAVDFIGSTDENRFNSEELEYNTTYNWRIDSINAIGVTTGTVWQFTTANVPAEFVAYESFDELATGKLFGQGGVENGWLRKWEGNDTESVSVVSTPLIYNSGSLLINGGSQAVSISSLNSEFAFTRAFNDQQHGDVYLSMLIQRAAIDNEKILSIGLKEGSKSPTYQHTAGVCFGYPLGNVSAEVYSGAPQRISTGVAITNNVTYFIIVRVSRYGTNYQYEKSEVFVNPTSEIEPLTGWTSVVNGENESYVLNKLNVRTYFMNAGDSYIIDEIRIGTTYDSVILNSKPTGTIILIK